MGARGWADSYQRACSFPAPAPAPILSWGGASAPAPLGLLPSVQVIIPAGPTSSSTLPRSPPLLTPVGQNGKLNYLIEYWILYWFVSQLP